MWLRVLTYKFIFLYAVCSACLLYGWFQFAKGKTATDGNSNDFSPRIDGKSRKMAVPFQDKPGTEVILLTYQRSGSSFLGELFNQHKRAFYFFEPLWGLYGVIDSRGNLTSLNGTVRPAPRRGLEYQLAEDTAVNFLKCHMHKLPLETMAYYKRRVGYNGSQMVEKEFHDFLGFPGRHRLLDENGYIKCINTTNWPNDKKCVPLLQKGCLQSEIRAIKTLRLRMWQVEKMLRDNPNLKIIHLVRDPRGALISRFQAHEMEAKVEMEASTRCLDILRDYNARVKLDKVYPGRIMQIKYEDMAAQPMETSKAVYKFLNLDLPKHVEMWLWMATKMGMARNGNFGTMRTNSNATAWAWTDKIPFHVALEIDHICKDVYDVFGYKPFESIASHRKMNDAISLTDDFSEAFLKVDTDAKRTHQKLEEYRKALEKRESKLREQPAEIKPFVVESFIQQKVTDKNGKVIRTKLVPFSKS
ncbi:carbohydrate sulfotransferase 1 isoform X2 [Lingula anatina]|uniref:Carbohydrate sulfotransferase 1 isoform X2 n=1 Tax=Lingula anatina TaxID=7574 RepID=A0A1S3HIB9_LINAN|nr:carbohydrate sulfotransferase 1 isoform X2 [Lingula anatina]|eukprot:XP_013385860.1 carbohydrate sulfotransferase 1 isoform X2 [Lingula anatina]